MAGAPLPTRESRFRSLIAPKSRDSELMNVISYCYAWFSKVDTHKLAVSIPIPFERNM